MLQDQKAMFYERFAHKFDAHVNMYDTTRRLEVVFDRFLREMDLQQLRLLDAGCGTGWFSREAAKRGASIVALDVGLNLLRLTREKSGAKGVVGSALALPFRDGAFDCVVASEVIEHTICPRTAVLELVRVCREGGLVALTTPNRRWKPALWIANALAVREYQGYENWATQGELKRWTKEAGGHVVQLIGVHAFPFVFQRTWSLLRRLDVVGERVPGIMLNLCVLIRKHSVKQ